MGKYCIYWNTSTNIIQDFAFPSQSVNTFLLDGRNLLIRLMHRAHKLSRKSHWILALNVGKLLHSVWLILWFLIQIKLACPLCVFCDNCEKVVHSHVSSQNVHVPQKLSVDQWQHYSMITGYSLSWTVIFLSACISFYKAALLFSRYHVSPLSTCLAQFLGQSGIWELFHCALDQPLYLSLRVRVTSGYNVSSRIKYFLPH